MSIAGTILVVDRDAGFRESTCTILARRSHRCIGVATAGDALEAARVEDIDVALLDPDDVPRTAALALARLLREQVRDLAVVLLTRAGDLDAALDAARIGVFDYLFKPFGEDDLVNAVERAMDWRIAARMQRAEMRQLQQELVGRLTELRQTIGDAAIESTAGVERLVGRLYASNRAALDHAHRVRRHASGLASLLGVAGTALDDVAHAGLLHDVGRLALPARIAAKPTPLTDDEMTLCRAHPELAARVMQPVPLLRGAAAIVAATRERYDGTGYPGGLHRDAIPLGSVIVAVAELFDSLTGASIAVDPVSVSAANAELVRAAGTTFDPRVVERWLHYTETGLLQRARPAGRGCRA